MKFGETFTEYLQTNQERFLNKFCHVEYKRLKKVLKSCRKCRELDLDNNNTGEDAVAQHCHYNSCPMCDQMFFTELMKEASDVVGCFRQRVGRLLQLHVHNGMQRYFMYMFQCFANPQQATAQECQMLIEYVMMNAVAMRKILKKYDKVHGSANGSKFKSQMIAEHMEILHSPWLIELGAFYMNINQQSNDDKNSDGGRNPFSFDLISSEPVMTLMLPDSVKLECSLTCAICLELVFNPYALSCGHLFCKLCACSAASVMIFQGLKEAAPESKCPVCREVGVYSNAIHMMELDLLMKKDCKEYWKQRLVSERAEMVKQSKVYWEMQTKYMIGY